MDKNIRIDEIVTRLNAASDAYYGGQEEQMTNYEWDALFDELTALEKATGYVRPDSPTQVTSHSGNEMDGEGEKEAHEYPALSLAKTKKVEELQDWAGERDIWLSWKLDGSTLVATYDGGALTRVLTRGNGTVGTNITYMASAIRGIPAKISDKGHLVVRGEATISYADFEAINDTLEDADEEYKDKAGDLGYNKDNYEYIAVKHQWQAAQYTYNAAVQNFELSFRSLYDSVQSYASALNAAKVSLECERSDLAAAQLRYEQGTISENALHTAEDELYTAQDTVSGAERDLFTAYNNYRWAVDYGLLAG